MRHMALAISFACFHQQGVKLIEERFVGRQVLMKKLLRGIVVGGGGKQLMARKNAARVCVGNEYRMPAGIKQNGVRCFRTDSIVRQ